nr:hypothetical protein GCM10020092_008190 [Actinoplanes digitatis]
MGAGALCRLLADTPGRFERIVLYLPAPLDGVRPPQAEARLTRLLAAVESGEAALVADAVEPELPPSVRNTPTGWSYLRQRVEQLLTDGLAPRARHPVAGARGAGHLGAGVVPGPGAGDRVRGGDDVHPVPVAERLAALLPDAELHVYDRPSGALDQAHRATPTRLRLPERLIATPRSSG